MNHRTAPFLDHCLHIAPHAMPLNHGYSYRQTLGPECRGETALSYLASNFCHSSIDEWQQRIERGEVTVNDQPATTSMPLVPGSFLIWHRPGWVEPDVPTHYQVIHEDRELLVIDKPGGLPTLPGAGFLENTLLTLVQRTFPEALPLHRLGRATSGLVLFARNPQIAGQLQCNWSRVRKQYQALAQGVAARDLYDIRTPIGRQPHPRLGQVFAASPSGKPSQSIARVVERRATTTVFEVDLLTGRPHQIRIHLASIGHPLEGDPLYESGGLPRAADPGLPGDAGYWLHAKRLQLAHPGTGIEVEFTSPLPSILGAGF